jgi:hypothetical protein
MPNPGWTKGVSGNPAGKKPGTLNRSSYEAREIMEKLGFNPIHELIKRYNDQSLTERTHNFCLEQLVARFAPELKTVQVNSNQALTPQNVQINILSPDASAITQDHMPAITAEILGEDALDEGAEVILEHENED